MKTIRTLVGRLREFKTASILTPLFIIGEVVLECLIPLTMVSLVDALDGVSLSPVMRLGLILTGLAFASLACGILSARFAATASVGLAKNCARISSLRCRTSRLRTSTAFRRPPWSPA